MAFDESLAERIRGHLRKRTGVVEKRMFGGLIFMLRGNMCCGVQQDALIVRLGPDEASRALSERHTRVFDLAGRPMKAWVLVDATGLAQNAVLGTWLDRAAKWVGSLPPK